ncbi:hypothetical protein J5J01_20305 [Streptomyces fradiae]|uniref:hypothetical protein n=1 Tax=Streptomyces fradiae TaxID=1906 RepID=UPI002018D1D8|nr:hypothetical protein [Streptomyces fradiae]UQS29296.1 hypothetical protein J5J01_20305 [Streptomyces fradiae]
MSRPERGALPLPLPLPDFDELPVGALESRIRSLRPDELDRLLEYEEEHAGRPRVVRRRAAGRLDEGAEPTGGDPAALRPERAGRAAGGSPVSPATSPQPSSPPPYGIPDQRGKPKGDRTV